MKCPAEIVIQQFIDRELTPAEAREAEAHLEECRRCRQLAAQMKEENAGIGRGFAIDGPVPDLEAAIMDKIVSPGSKGRSALHWLLPLAASMLLLVFLYVLVLIDGRGPGPEPETRILVYSARVEGAPTRLHIYDSKDPEVKFIWLEKIQYKEKSDEEVF
jgi:predicted anti-sigma-YlaC factor YlaD